MKSLILKQKPDIMIAKYEKCERNGRFMNLAILIFVISAFLMVIAFFGVARVKFRIIEVVLTYVAVTAVLFLNAQLSTVLFPEPEAVSLWLHFAVSLLTHSAPIAGIFIFAAYRKTGILSLSAFFAVFSMIILNLSGSISAVILTPDAMEFILQIAGEDFNSRMWVSVFAHYFVLATITFALAYTSGMFLKKKFLILDEQIKRSLALYLFLVAAFVNVAFGSLNLSQHVLFTNRDASRDRNGYTQVRREEPPVERRLQFEVYGTDTSGERQTLRPPVRIRDGEPISGRQDMRITRIGDGEPAQDAAQAASAEAIAPRRLPNEPLYILQAPVQQLIVLYTAVILILMVAMVLFIGHSLSMKFDLRQKEDRIMALRENTENLESLSLEARAFRHDHENLMLSFHEYLKNGDIDGAREYYENYMASFYKSVKNINEGLDILGKVNTPELKGILCHKLPSAQRAGIKVVIDISAELEPIPVEHLLDVCRIVGILLDNAIEGCKAVEKPELHFGILSKSPATLIVVENNFLSPPDLDKLSEKGYTTKEDGRGLGLYTANQIAQNNPNLSLLPQIKRGRFVQLLTILP